MTEYVNKMRSLGDEMAAAGRPLDEEELVEYVLANLDYDYNGTVSAIVGRSTPISIAKAYSQLVAFETRLALTGGGGVSSGSSVNVASRGGRSGGNFNLGRGGGLGRAPTRGHG